MNITKRDVSILFKNLPDSCTLEDIQYHLYVLEKNKRGIQRSNEEGTIDHKDVESSNKEWLNQ